VERSIRSKNPDMGQHAPKSTVAAFLHKFMKLGGDKGDKVSPGSSIIFWSTKEVDK
jgi:hypothetical protein